MKLAFNAVGLDLLSLAEFMVGRTRARYHIVNKAISMDWSFSGQQSRGKRESQPVKLEVPLLG